MEQKKNCPRMAEETVDYGFRPVNPREHEPCFDELCPMLSMRRSRGELSRRPSLASSKSSSSATPASDLGDKGDGHRIKKKAKVSAGPAAEESIYDVCKRSPRRSAREAVRRMTEARQKQDARPKGMPEARQPETRSRRALRDRDPSKGSARAGAKEPAVKIEMFCVDQAGSDVPTAVQKPAAEEEEEEAEAQPGSVPFFFEPLGRAVPLPRFTVQPMEMHPLDLRKRLFPYL